MQYAKRCEIRVTLRYVDSNVNAPFLLRDIPKLQEKISEVLPQFEVEDCSIYLQELTGETDI